MAKRKKEFIVEGTPALFTEHFVTAQLQEARDEAKRIVDEGYFARITKVKQPVPRGERVYYIVWQRGKPSIKGRVALSAVESVFGKQRQVF